MSETTYAQETYPESSELEGELPSLEIDEESGDEADGPPAEASAGATEAAARPAAPKSNRSLIRRVAAKTQETQQAPALTRTITAALLGCGDDIVELVTAIMTAGREVRQPLADLDTILECLANEPWEAGVIATSLDRTRQKSIWSLLGAVKAVNGLTPPVSTAKAGSAIVKGIAKLSEADRAALSDVADLLKRS